MSITKTRVVGPAIAALALAGVVIAQSPSRKASASPSPSSAAIPMPKTDRMPMEEFKRLLAKGEVVVIDVRSVDSYALGHIPGALSMPEEAINDAVAEKLKKMGKPIATYCS